MSEEDDIDQSLDDNDQAIEDRRRSRSFFSETDVSSGLKSALPPQVGSSGARDSLGQPVIMVERTGALNSKEIMALREGLKSEMVKGDVGRDSDLDVDEEVRLRGGGGTSGVREWLTRMTRFTHPQATYNSSNPRYAPPLPLPQKTSTNENVTS